MIIGNNFHKFRNTRTIAFRANANQSVLHLPTKLCQTCPKHGAVAGPFTTPTLVRFYLICLILLSTVVKTFPNVQLLVIGTKNWNVLLKAGS